MASDRTTPATSQPMTADPHTITLRLTPTLAARVGLCARLRGISAAAVAIDALTDYVENTLADPSTHECLRALHDAERKTLAQRSATAATTDRQP